jgi:hypothetical protein
MCKGSTIHYVEVAPYTLSPFTSVLGDFTVYRCTVEVEGATALSKYMWKVCIMSILQLKMLPSIAYSTIVT